LHEQTWPGIFSSTAGIVFLSTPHRGTGPQTSKGLVLAAIAANLQVEPKILEVLVYENDVLMEVLDDFITTCKAHNKPISCFFEQKISNVGKVISGNNIKVSRSPML
jgi:hypothetical protein